MSIDVSLATPKRACRILSSPSTGRCTTIEKSLTFVQSLSSPYAPLLMLLVLPVSFDPIELLTFFWAIQNYLASRAAHQVLRLNATYRARHCQAQVACQVLTSHSNFYRKVVILIRWVQLFCGSFSIGMHGHQVSERNCLMVDTSVLWTEFFSPPRRRYCQRRPLCIACISLVPSLMDSSFHWSLSFSGWTCMTLIESISNPC